MSQPTGDDEGRWQDGSLESGSDDQQGVAPGEGGPGAEIGMTDEPTTFEPEEDPEAAGTDDGA